MQGLMPVSYGPRMIPVQILHVNPELVPDTIDTDHERTIYLTACYLFSDQRGKFSH